MKNSISEGIPIAKSQQLYTQLSDLINQVRSYVTKNINSAMVVLYWQIGKTIKENEIIVERAEYGKEIVKNVAAELQNNYGKGFGYANLTRMISFYNSFPNSEIVATLSQQLSWSHIVEIIKIKDQLKREFYITMSINEGWSVRQLSGRINSMLFERTAISKKPEETIVKQNAASL